MELKQLGKAINKEHFARRCKLKRYRVHQLFAGTGNTITKQEWDEVRRVLNVLKKEINETTPKVIQA